MATHDPTARLLKLVAKALRTGASQLYYLEKSLVGTLHQTRNLGMEHGCPEAWNPHWRAGWTMVEASLHSIIHGTNELERSLESTRADRLEAAMVTWNGILAENARMVATLHELSSQSPEMTSPVLREWTRLEQHLETHAETIYACACALRIKLEWSRAHSWEEIDALVEGYPTGMPARPVSLAMPSGPYALERGAAAGDMTASHSSFLGGMGEIKTLFAGSAATTATAPQHQEHSRNLAL